MTHRKTLKDKSIKQLSNVIQPGLCNWLFWADFINSDMHNWASFMNKMCGICGYLFEFKEHSFNKSIVYSENVSKLRFLTKVWPFTVNSICCALGVCRSGAETHTKQKATLLVRRRNTQKHKPILFNTTLTFLKRWLNKWKRETTMSMLWSGKWVEYYIFQFIQSISKANSLVEMVFFWNEGKNWNIMCMLM